MTAAMAWTLGEIDALVRSGADASAALEWFWREGPWPDRYVAFITAARAWCKRSPAARAVFERLRPPTPVRHGARFPELMNWLAISDALDLGHEVLAWFDARVAAGDVPLPGLSRLLCLLLERGQLEDFRAFSSAAETAVGLTENLTSQQELGLPADLLEEELANDEVEIIWWRLIAQHTEPERLAEIDAAIDASPRAKQLRKRMQQSPEALRQAMLAQLR
jgi:hypothetical protein